MKLRVFVASSVEDLSVAYAVQECLVYEFEVTVWPQGVFALTKTALDTLDEQSKLFDAAQRRGLGRMEKSCRDSSCRLY